MGRDGNETISIDLMIIQTSILNGSADSDPYKVARGRASCAAMRKMIAGSAVIRSTASAGASGRTRLTGTHRGHRRAGRSNSQDVRDEAVPLNNNNTTVR